MSDQELSLLRERVTALEQHLDWLYNQLGQPSPYPADTAGGVVVGGHPVAISGTVRALIDRGETVAAVKQLRTETGLGLADAAHAVKAAKG